MPRFAALMLAFVLLTAPAMSAGARPAASSLTTTTARAVADGTVSAAAPRRSTGRLHVLRAGPGRRDRAYLRFAVPQLGGAVQTVTLRLWARSARRAGLEVSSLGAGVRWTERGLRFRNAPRGGRLVARTSRVRRGRIDVPLDRARLGLDPGHPLNLAIAARPCAGCRVLVLSSREVRSRAPRLLIGVARPTPPPPDTTPPAVTVTSPAAGAATDAQPTFAGTGEPGQATVRVTPAAGGAAVATYTVTVGSDGHWSTRAQAPVQPGAMQATASESDTAGNVGTSAPVSFDVIPTVAAAGDIACPPGQGSDAIHCQQHATSDLLVDQGYHRVLALGDNQYPSGALSDFLASYDPTWGRVRSITSPILGNHEYSATYPPPTGSTADGYFDYFDGVGQSAGPAGPRGDGWYSFDLGSWHIIALNSMCALLPNGGAADGCASGSPQETWLRADLAAHPAACTLAYWHYPRYSSGNASDSNHTEMTQFWDDLMTAKAELVLAGHQHGYERFVPMDGADHATPNGLREIVIGSGGEDFHGFNPPTVGSVVINKDTFGVLRLSLRATGYDWRFVPIAGKTFTDSGSADCH